MINDPLYRRKYIIGGIAVVVVLVVVVIGLSFLSLLSVIFIEKYHIAIQQTITTINIIKTDTSPFFLFLKFVFKLSGSIFLIPITYHF